MGDLDFELDLREHDWLHYQISALVSVGESSTIVAFPLTDAGLENQLLQLENAILRSTGRRRIPQTAEERLQSFGQQLFGFLLHGNVSTHTVDFANRCLDLIHQLTSQWLIRAAAELRQRCSLPFPEAVSCNSNLFLFRG